MKTTHEARRVLATEGSILLEVVVAVLVLSVLIGPMVAAIQSAVGRAAAVRSQMSQVADFPGASASEQGWEWGPQITCGTWRPGPVLQIRVRTAGGANPIVGVWVNGWFSGEHSPEVDGSLSLSPRLFRGFSGQDLVVRVRGPGAPWGPPWRSIVPEADGTTSVLMAALESTSGEGKPGAAVSVAHVPGLANPELAASWGETPVANSAPGVPFVLAPAMAGECNLSLGGGIQSWSMEGERALDVYF